jgi:hypothetical protein
MINNNVVKCKTGGEDEFRGASFSAAVFVKRGVKSCGEGGRARNNQQVAHKVDIRISGLRHAD